MQRRLILRDIFELELCESGAGGQPSGATLAPVFESGRFTARALTLGEVGRRLEDRDERLAGVKIPDGPVDRGQVLAQEVRVDARRRVGRCRW